VFFLVNMITQSQDNDRELDKKNFEKWLRNRHIPPSIGLLSNIRKYHNDKKISIYSVKESIEDLGLKDINVFRFTIYLHNQYYPCLTEEHIQTILHNYEKTLELSLLHCAYVTYEVILSIIGEKYNIDTDIKKNTCPICLEDLKWDDNCFDKCNHAYCKECMPKTCIICRI
jgi:hypothetical protein